MCDFLDSIFGVDRSGEQRLTSLLGVQTKDALASSATASHYAKAAVDDATKASAPTIDNEDARLAAERRMRRMLGVEPGGGIPAMGAAPIGYRALTGA